MANSAEPKQTGTITCPYCGASSGGAFSTVVEGDDAGPAKILYKCSNCGKFYTAERVISWRITKT